jgi:hypothetical protein
MDVTTIFKDDELIPYEQLRWLFGAPDKPLSAKTISRMVNRPDGLPTITIGGRKYARLSAAREYVRNSERRLNPRRKRT